MAKFTILCLVGLITCDAGFIPSQLVYPHFPNLNTVHHGQGATSYQNVQVQNYGSVPIPKDLQVDDGHEYHHSQYLHHDVDDTNEIPSLGLQNYVDDDRVAVNDFVVSTKDPYVFNEYVEQVDHSELEPQHHYIPNHYEHYDHEADYEYH